LNGPCYAYFAMIADLDTNIVYISNRLRKRQKAVAEALKAGLGDRLRTIPRTKDIWCRDFMPIQLAPDSFVQFRFDPDYLEDAPHLRTGHGARLLGLTNCVISDLVVDGGNIVRWQDAAIMTDKVFDENPAHPEPELRRMLQETLKIERLIVVPTEPEDQMGHADGMVRFVDGKRVLVNDYRHVIPGFNAQLAEKLDGFEIIPFPYHPTDQPGLEPHIPPATGAYINFLQTHDTIFVPQFGLAGDRDAATILGDLFPQCGVIPVPCHDLALRGGVLNCVTWNIKEG
jgi:agmatine deiminase